MPQKVCSSLLRSYSLVNPKSQSLTCNRSVLIHKRAEDTYVLVLIQHNIFKLQVPMYAIIHMHIAHCTN